MRSRRWVLQFFCRFFFYDQTDVYLMPVANSQIRWLACKYKNLPIISVAEQDLLSQRIFLCLCKWRYAQVAKVTRYTHVISESSPAGKPVVPSPPFKIYAPHFMFGFPVAAYIQYCNCNPLWLLAPLLRNPGNCLCHMPRIYIAPRYGWTV